MREPPSQAPLGMFLFSSPMSVWFVGSASRAAAEDSRVLVIRRESNGGIVAASQDALAAATGEYVALLDHDDVFEPDALETMSSALADADVNLQMITTSEIKISVLIDRKYMELAVQALHDTFGLEKAA